MPQRNEMTRRTFVSSVSAAAAGCLVVSPIFNALAHQEMKTVQDVIDFLRAAAPEASFAKTVDTVKSGDPSQAVRGIVTTFMANAEVIKRAISLGANLIVTHEPTYYNHEDNTDWLADDQIYKYKMQLLRDNNIVVFRYHDYIHSIKPDPMVVAVGEKLGWMKYADKDNPRMYSMPSQKLSALAKTIKLKLGSESVRYVGPSDMDCRRIGLLVGAAGGTSHINMLSKTDIDVLVVGEIHEWETSEYIRDTISSGKNKAVIVAGHAPTEEPGMQWLAGWLQPKLRGIKVTHVPGVAPFEYV